MVKVVKFLHEIAFDKQTVVLRLLGSLITYLTDKIYTAVLINEKNFQHVCGC